MLLLKLGSELPNLVKKFLSVLKIWTKCKLNFHEVEYFHEAEWTPPHRLLTFSYFLNPCSFLLAPHTFYSGFENILFRENGMYC